MRLTSICMTTIRTGLCAKTIGSAMRCDDDDHVSLRYFV